jgi:nitrate reductase gamma subunit
MIERTLFIIGPYAACAVLVIVVLLKLTTELRQAMRPRLENEDGVGTVTPLPSLSPPPHRPTWRARPLTIGSLAMVVIGHLPLLLAPHAVLSWNRAFARLLAYELLVFVPGLIAFASLAGVMRDRLRRDDDLVRRARLADSACLALLLTAVISGLILAVRYRWASSWSATVMAPYVRSLATFQPDIAGMAVMPYIVVLHVLSGIAVIGCMPFTSASDWLLSRIARLAARALIPVIDPGRRRWRRIQAWAWQRGQQMLWPDPDD